MRLRRTLITATTALILAAIAIALLWVWSVANSSVALLDRIDRLFGDGQVAQLAGPVSFGEDSAQKLFVYRSKQAPESTTLPVLVFIHGGGWHSGDPQDYAFAGRNLADEDMLLVNIGYRLNHNGKFPAMLEDSAKAVRWVYDNIADYGGNPNEIYLIGHSAGAYNAVMLALDRQWLGREGLDDSLIKGAIGLAGPYDFHPFTTDSARNALGEWPKPLETQPITHARADAPPLLLATGSKDTVVKPRNSAALAKAMEGLGAHITHRVFEGMDHKDILITLARPFDRDQRTKHEISAFLASLRGNKRSAGHTDPAEGADEATRPTSVPVQEPAR